MATVVKETRTALVVIGTPEELTCTVHTPALYSILGLLKYTVSKVPKNFNAV